MKYGNIVRQACLARNSSVIYGRVRPLELAFGRRPRDDRTLENSEPYQLTGSATDAEVTARAIREVANRTYQEARQSDDLRTDLAPRLKDASFWVRRYITGLSTLLRTSKVGSAGSRQGAWVKGKVVSELGGSMVGVTRIVRVNISKLRRNYGVKSDVEIALSPPKEAMTSEESDHAS